jgi:antitoxin MazE
VQSYLTYYNAQWYSNDVIVSKRAMTFPESLFRKESLDNPSFSNYIVIMITRIIRIGNSQGVRIPKLFLEQTGLSDKVELEMQNGEIIIRSAEHPRQGWDEAFRAMAAHGDDALLDEDSLNQSSWDETEWQW